MSEEANTEVTTRKVRITKKRLLFVCAFAAILLIASAGAFLWHSKSQENKLPKEVKSQISGFQPYYFPPKEQLPEGFVVDKKSIRYEVGTLLFTLNSTQGKTINVSQQPLPKEFSAEGGAFVGKDSFDTPNGKVTLSFVGGRTSAFLITKDHNSLVILNSNQTLSSDTVRVVLSSLVKS